MSSGGDETFGGNPLMAMQPSGQGEHGPGDETGGVGGLGADLVGAGGAGPRKPRIHSGVLVLMLVLTIAGGLLLGMRKLALGGRLKFVEIKIDYPLETVGKSRARDAAHTRVLDDLSTGGSVVQIPLSKLTRNPFELETPADVTKPLLDSSLSEAQRLSAQQEARLREIEMTFAALELNSVITGAVPVARISGQAVRVGDTIADLFTVVAIHGRSVDLAAKDAPNRTFTLDLSDPGVGSSPRGKRRH